MPAPSRNSASVATWTSLPTRTFVPSASASVSEREAALPAGQVAGAGDVAGALVDVAGGADPDPDEIARSRLRPAAAASRIAAAIAAATSFGPAAGRRRPPRLAERPCRAASTIAVWIFVPPRSMPPRSFGLLGLMRVRRLPSADPHSEALLELGRLADRAGWRLWWAKRRWYERNRRLLRRRRINRHAARGGFFIRYPVEGEVLEALDEGRLRIGEGTLLEPGCWITMSPEARIEIGEGCFLNRNTMLAAQRAD